jgi:aerobic carbon-monoxide dehydrogenase medium subunit
VKPAPFDYVRAAGVDEAIGCLGRDDGAKVIAGGQSLVPLMSMRLARPTVLVDVNDLPLDVITVDAGVVRIGATVRHRKLELDPVIRRAAPLLAEAAAHIAHPAIRVRGTIGGSLAHADPLAELPAVLVASGGSVVVRGSGGDRTIKAADLFEGFLTTSIAPDELVTEVRLAAAGPRHGAAFCEWAPRAGDFAVAGIGVIVERDADGRCETVRGAALGIGSVPLDCSAALEGAVGESLVSDALLRDVARRVRLLARDNDDRAELAGLLAARALVRAAERASGTAEAAA